MELDEIACWFLIKFILYQLSDPPSMAVMRSILRGLVHKILRKLGTVD